MVWLCGSVCQRTPLRLGLLTVATAAGHWLPEFTDLRDLMNKQAPGFSIQHMRSIALEAKERIEASGRDFAIPKLSERALARMEAEAARAAAMEEQSKEERLLQKLQAMRAARQSAVPESQTVLVA